jgi:hypothetical protein
MGENHLNTGRLRIMSDTDVRITNFGMSSYISPHMAALLSLADIIVVISREMEKDMHKRREARRPRLKRGATLRPSDDTPLWNALVSLVAPRLRRRGARALLARDLGLHRARPGELFFRRTMMPDAERTLRLLVWLSRQTTDKLEAVF